MLKKIIMPIALIFTWEFLPVNLLAQNDTLYIRSKVGAFKLMDRGFGFLGTARHHNKEADFTNFVNYHAAFALWIGAVTSSGEMRVTSGSGNEFGRTPEWAPRPETFQIKRPANLPSVEKNTIASYADGLEIEGHKPLGVSVEQKVYGMKDGKFAIVDFAITLSNSVGELRDFYPGFWSDIDVPSNDGRDTPDDDKIGFALNNKAVLIYDGGTESEIRPLLGAMILGTDTPIVSWWREDGDPEEDTQKYSYLAGENERVTPETPGDYRFLLSYGPFAISSGETIHFSIALVQANDLNTVENNFTAAEEFYNNDLGLTGLPKKHEKLVESENMPSDYRLYPNFPNPFNPTTEIRFDLREATPVQLLIHDLAGRVVRHLIEAEYQPGRYFATWDGRNDVGMPLASGIYLCKLRAGNFQAQRKLVLMK